MKHNIYYGTLGVVYFLGLKNRYYIENSSHVFSYSRGPEGPLCLLLSMTYSQIICYKPLWHSK